MGSPDEEEPRRRSVRQPAACVVDLLKSCMLVVCNLENKLCFGVCVLLLLFTSFWCYYCLHVKVLNVPQQDILYGLNREIGRAHV